jgi:O-antigen/teichoic acid export membrane protein
LKKVLKNVLASALPQIMNIITNLILPGLIIANYGSEVNGLISSTKSIVAYISIVGAGIATAVTQALYEPVAKKNTDTIKGMLNAANKMFFKYGILYCVLAIICAIVYPLSLRTNIRYITMVALMIVMSISGASEFFVIGRCRSLLYANQKTYVCTSIQAVSLLGSLILALIMLKMHVNIVLVQFAISFVYILRAFLLNSYVNKYYPELSDYKNTPPINTAVEKRSDAMIHQLSGLAVSGSQTTILTVTLGLNAASIYSVYNIVFSGLQSICANLSTALTPFLGRELALDRKERLMKFYDFVEFVFFNLVTFIYSVAMVMVVPFVSIYTMRADISYIYPVFASLFVLSSAFYILKLPSNSLINISGQFKETRSRAIIEASLTIVLSIIFTIIFGIEGVVVGTGIALCWRCIDTIIYTNKNVINCGNFKSLFRLARSIAIIICFWGIHKIMPVETSNYLQWIKIALFCSVFALLVIICNAILFDRKTLAFGKSLVHGYRKHK